MFIGTILIIPFCDVITLHHVFIFVFVFIILSLFFMDITHPSVLVNVLNHMYLIMMNY